MTDSLSATTFKPARNPDWDPTPATLVTRDELRQAAALARSVGINDLRLGPIVRALVARDADLSKSLLENELAARHSTVAKFVREVLRLASLTVVEDLRDVARHLALIYPESRKRDIAIFVQRYGGGAEGNDASTLQAVADVHGITRERVRQLTDAMLGRATAHSVFSPAFSRLVDALGAVLPRSDLDASEALRHLLGRCMSLSGALRYGTDVLKAELPVQLARFQRQSGVHTLLWRQGTDSDNWLKAAQGVATSMVRSCGLAYLPRVTCEVEKITGHRIGASGVSSALATIRNIEWLDERQEWFWFVDESHKNRLVIAIRKIMAAARRPVDIEEIYGGIARMRGDRVRLVGPYPPPPWAVQAFYSRLSILKCRQSNHFLPAIEMSVGAELSASERMIYRHMEPRGGLGSRRELNRMLVERGQCKHLTLQTTIATSPIFKQIDRGVFGLRGWPLSATALQRTQTEVGLPGNMTE